MSKRDPDVEITQVIDLEELDLPPAKRSEYEGVTERSGYAPGRPRKRPRSDTLVENMRRRKNLSPRLPADPGGGRLPPFRAVIKNPRTGEHPDLFTEGMTPVFVPLAELSEKQILALPRSAFNDDEWDDVPPELRGQIMAREIGPLIGKPLKDIDYYVWNSLDEGTQDEILEASPLVEKMVEAFKAQMAVFEDPTDAYHMEQATEDLSQQLDSDVLDVVRRNYRGSYDIDDLIESWVADGFDSDQVDEEVENALQEVDNWSIEPGDEYYSYGVYKLVVVDSLYIGRDELEEITEGMEDPEIEEAIKQINREINLHLDQNDLKKRSLEIDDIARHYYDATTDWEKIEESVKNAMEGTEPTGKIQELSKDDPEKIVYRFKDGAYVYDVPPAELPHEGSRMGHCVGQPGMGYGRAVHRGEIKIFSIRTEVGRPKFTIEAEMGDAKRGRVVRIKQFKGKANRLPGWDLNKIGQGKLKKDEVEKAVEWIEHIGLDPEEVSDLRPGYSALTEGKTNPIRRNAPACPVGHDHQSCDGFCLPYRRSK